ISLLAAIAILTVLKGHARLILEDAHTNKETPISKKPPKDCDTFQVVKKKSSIPTIKSLARDIHSHSQTATVAFYNPLLSLESRQSKRIVLPKSSDSPLTSDQYLIVNKAFLGITILYTLPPNIHKIE
ncbi:unnamed protein product, partial [Clonostachys solani]